MVRAAGETDQRHLAVEFAADDADRVKDITQLVHVGHGQAAHVVLGAHGMREARPFASGEVSPRPMACGTVRMSENRMAASRSNRASGLQGDFRGVVGILSQAHERTRRARVSLYSGR